MTLSKKIHEEYPDMEILLADGFDDAFIGIGQQFSKFMAVYDKSKCIEILTDQGLSPDDAQEYMDYNVYGAYMGDNTPVFIERLEL
jgi:hypothetical protein|tara:strand:+ start:119 stop:376 length:258 start_codon:yes stop_codon:yes gene_type:complete